MPRARPWQVGQDPTASLHRRRTESHWLTPGHVVSDPTCSPHQKSRVRITRSGCVTAELRVTCLSRGAAATLPQTPGYHGLPGKHKLRHQHATGSAALPRPRRPVSRPLLRRRRAASGLRIRTPDSVNFTHASLKYKCVLFAFETGSLCLVMGSLEPTM